jgi:hypothetical protein
MARIKVRVEAVFYRENPILSACYCENFSASSAAVLRALSGKCFSAEQAKGSE